MNTTIKITVRFPPQLKEMMLKALIGDGYSLHEKSKWVGEAIDNFLKIRDFVDFVDIGCETSDIKLPNIQSFYLSQYIVNHLEEAIVEVRKKYPKMEGVKSNIVRSSVFQRLFRQRD